MILASQGTQKVDAAIEHAAFAVSLGEVLNQIACAHHGYFIFSHALLFQGSHLRHNLLAKRTESETEKIREIFKLGDVIHGAYLSLNVEFGFWQFVLLHGYCLEQVLDDLVHEDSVVALGCEGSVETR